MKFVLLIILAFHSYSIFAAITFKLEQNPQPTNDESIAYLAIEKAMNAAVDRYNIYVTVNTTITVKYVPSVRTADGNRDSRVIRFGPHPVDWTERVALHEISHILGVGWQDFDKKCQDKSWNEAKILLREFSKKKKAEFSCGGRHFWPYGLNFEKEFSEEEANRHCRIIQAMINDGMK